MEPMQPPEPSLPSLPLRSTPISPGGPPGWAAAPPPPRGPAPWSVPQSRYGGPLPPATRSHGLATAALVCGLVGLVTFWAIGIVPLLGLIFGLISAKAIKNSSGTLTGLGKARAGWITGLIGVIGAALLFWAIGTGRIDTDTDDTSSYNDADVGDCVETVPDEGLVFGLDFISCDEPHAAEVYALGDLNPGRTRDYPGDTTVLTEVEEACFVAFEPYVGRSYGESVFEVYYLYPRNLGWRTEGGGYVCMVGEVGKLTVGSAFHSDR